MECVIAEEEKKLLQASYLYSTKHSLHIKHLKKLFIWLVLCDTEKELDLQQLLNIK